MKKIQLVVVAVVFMLLFSMTSFAESLSCGTKTAANVIGSVRQKTLYVIGDSYSTFDEKGNRSNAFYYPFNKAQKNDVESLHETWRARLCEKAGLSMAGVDAYSGSCLSDRPEDDIPSMLERIEADPKKDTSIIILMGGLNDAWQHIEIGSVEEISAVNRTQYAPALRSALQLLKDSNPNSMVIYSLVVYDDEVKPYAVAAAKICADLNVTFVPIYGSDIQCAGYHPTCAGMETIANVFMPYVTDATITTVKHTFTCGD